MISIDLSGKTAVITGSARGIGRAIAEKLAEAGANIIISDIMAEVGEVTAKEIADKYSVKTAFVEANVTKEEDNEKVVATAVEQFGSIDIMAAVRSLIFIGKVRKDPTTRVLIHEKSSLAPPGETMAFKLGDEEGFRWVGAYEISADELLDGKEGKATETKLERGRKLIRELLADKKEISIRELDEKAKEQGISGRTMRDVRSRMKNELEYQVNEKQENSIRLKE
mgnify:CR=1 FL=1